MTATTTTNANVSRAAVLSAALDNAIAALTALDADRLEEIEGSVSASLAQTEGQKLIAFEPEMQEIVARHRLLGTLLASTSLNLNVLVRLHSRNSIGDVTWVP